ncbi:MAG: hypothetical protein WBX11_18715 [Thiobacillaceae bacterium]
MEIRPPAELAALRAIWLEDPYWAIEDTDGFEAHRDELRKFRLETDAKNEQAKQSRLMEFIDQHQADMQNLWTAEPVPGQPKSDAG